MCIFGHKSTLFEDLLYNIYLSFQQNSCCGYGLVPEKDTDANGGMGGYDCLMIPGTMNLT